MWYSQTISLDPMEMENCFSTDDALQHKTVSFFNDLKVDSVRDLMAKLPDLEADFVYLYFEANKKQSDIAEIFGCTQAAVSYRLKKAVKRIQFLLSLPQVTEAEMIQDLKKIMSITDVDILMGMYHTTCQSWVAENLGLSQGLVRHRFFKSIKALQRNEKYKDPYFIIFDEISKNFNILKEVVLPQWHHHQGNILMGIEVN